MRVLPKTIFRTWASEKCVVVPTWGVAMEVPDLVALPQLSLAKLASDLVGA